MLDLSKPASRHNVTSCFTNDQAGSYFDGSGHALFSESVGANGSRCSRITSEPCVCVCVFFQCAMDIKSDQMFLYLWSSGPANQKECF